MGVLFFFGDIGMDSIVAVLAATFLQKMSEETENVDGRVRDVVWAALESIEKNAKNIKNFPEHTFNDVMLSLEVAKKNISQPFTKGIEVLKNFFYIVLIKTIISGTFVDKGDVMMVYGYLVGDINDKKCVTPWNVLDDPPANSACSIVDGRSVTGDVVNSTYGGFYDQGQVGLVQSLPNYLTLANMTRLCLMCVLTMILMILVARETMYD